MCLAVVGSWDKLPNIPHIIERRSAPSGNKEPTRQYNVVFLAGEAQAPSYTGSDVPDQDVDDNENAAPPPPSAPPADMFGSYAGYENVGFGK